RELGATQKLAAGIKSLDAVAGCAKEAVEGFSYRCVVVDDEHKRTRGSPGPLGRAWRLARWGPRDGSCDTAVPHDSSLCGAIGNATWNVAPTSELFVAQMRPPCASTTERANESPMPSPSGFVEKNCSNMRSNWSCGIPVPASRMEMTQHPSVPPRVRMIMRRSPGTVLSIASKP